MAIAREREKVTLKVTISPELHDQIAAKAEQMQATTDQVVAVLLKLGLAVQDEREERLCDLVERHRSGEDLTEKIGEALFGK